MNDADSNRPTRAVICLLGLLVVAIAGFVLVGRFAARANAYADARGSQGRSLYWRVTDVNLYDGKADEPFIVLHREAALRYLRAPADSDERQGGYPRRRIVRCQVRPPSPV
jgi:hypothetical protein